MPLKVFFIAVLSFLFNISFAQDGIEGFWFNQERTAKIQIYKAKDTKFYGKIVWLKEPERDGKPKVDENNPDAGKRTQPIIGLLILKGFQKDGEVYEDGTIYDPKNGKTYSCKIKRKGNNLDVRGYVGISMLGRTTTWTKAD
ncbi:MAG TPA: DUF2147 domain-containing protein [Flavipsychrobacter sp.]|nr:DUF2147 domain-containing protein [Flavipsychrobacter sp.]